MVPHCSSPIIIFSQSGNLRWNSTVATGLQTGSPSGSGYKLPPQPLSSPSPPGSEAQQRATGLPSDCEGEARKNRSSSNAVVFLILLSFLSLRFLQLTDFGLAKLYYSVSRVSKKASEEEAGTISYMPPEAFGISYNPSKASDIYRYIAFGGVFSNLSVN